MIIKIHAPTKCNISKSVTYILIRYVYIRCHYVKWVYANIVDKIFFFYSYSNATIRLPSHCQGEVNCCYEIEFNLYCVCVFITSYIIPFKNRKHDLLHRERNFLGDEKKNCRLRWKEWTHRFWGRRWRDGKVIWVVAV